MHKYINISMFYKYMLSSCIYSVFAQRLTILENFENVV